MSDDPITSAAAPPPKQQRAKRKPALPPDQWQAVQDIAEQLQEKQRGLLVSLVQHMGLDFAQALLQDTLAIEAQGGLLVQDGSRRRTAGGVFFFLAKQKLPSEVAQQVFPVMTWQERRERTKQRQRQWRERHPEAATARPAKPKEPERPPLVWEERHDIIAALLEAPGTASTAKVLLVGRPELFELFTDLAFITLTHPPRLHSLPRGVPRPDSGLVATHSVLIGLKQWATVEAALLADEQDVLVIEGFYAFSEPLGGMAVYATSATTHNLQLQQRQL